MPPPRVDEVLVKRLVYALKLAEQTEDTDIAQIRLHIPSVAIFLRALVESLKANAQIREFLSNITGGNIREAVSFVKQFIGSSNVDSEKIIEIYEREKRYLIPVHEFSKQALLGDYSHYEPKSSIALNLFDVRTTSPNAHFLCPLILAYLTSEGEHVDAKGFVDRPSLMAEFQRLSFQAGVIEDSIRRMTNRKLIETSERVTFEEDDSGLFGDLPALFRTTSIGAYHIKRWIGTFAYLDAMLIDTPIFDESVRDQIIPDINEFNIGKRFYRTNMFADYLRVAWANFDPDVSYFDFEATLKRHSSTFASVERAVAAQQK